MADYLDSYGVTDRKRERRIKQIVLVLGIAVIAAFAGFLFFRNFQEKRALNRFFDALKANNHQEAYRIWGCTPEAPCRDYSFEKFMEDWGPGAPYSNVQSASVANVDSCGTGVVMTLQYPNAEPFGIWVERETRTLGFAPWYRCPGRHLNLRGFFDNLFNRGPRAEMPGR
jgi:hypothetical protein